MNAADFRKLITSVYAHQGFPDLHALDTHPLVARPRVPHVEPDWAARLDEKNLNPIHLGQFQVHLGYSPERVPDHLMIHVPIGTYRGDIGLMINMLRFNQATQGEALGMGHFSVALPAEGSPGIVMYRAYMRVSTATQPGEVTALLGRLVPFAYAAADDCLRRNARLKDSDEDFGPHHRIRMGYGGLGVEGGMTAQDERSSDHEHSSDDEPMSRDESCDVVMGTPPVSPVHSVVGTPPGSPRH